MVTTSPIHSLSKEVAHLKRSVMRDLLGLATSPDIISLASGLPASEFLPIDEYSRCLSTVLKREGSRAMQYSPQFPPLRQWIAGYMRSKGVPCEENEVFITNGAQQGLAILSRLLLDPGQPAVIEAFTFTGIQQVTAGRGAVVRTVPTNLQTGVDIDALEAAFREQPTPRMAVIIPDFHNPLGVSLSPEKRGQIAALAAKYRVPVIEDDPYSALRFEGETLPPIKAYDEEGFVFYVGSFSKMLAPSVRLGWIVASADLIPKISVLRESIDLESSILTQEAVYEFLAQGSLEPHLKSLNATNRERRDVLLASLDEHLGGLATWTRPEGGLFVWVTLPADVDTWAMFEEAVARKVVYIPGAAFALDGGARNTMRLNFSNAKPENIREGVARLADVIKTQMALVSER
jgi:2-aminoadipate transaminase